MHQPIVRCYFDATNLVLLLRKSNRMQHRCSSPFWQFYLLFVEIVPYSLEYVKNKTYLIISLEGGHVKRKILCLQKPTVRKNHGTKVFPEKSEARTCSVIVVFKSRKRK